MSSKCNDKSLAAMAQIDLEIIKLDATEKEAYLEAVDKCDPDLIERESDPLLFIKYYDGDAKQAAKRLVYYWKLRKEIFLERAFLPLNQIGKGALSEEDVEIVRCGAVAILPNNIFYVDRWRFTDSMYTNTAGRLRTYFYFFNLCMHLESKVKNKDTTVLPQGKATGESGKIVVLVRMNDASAKTKIGSYDLGVPRILSDLLQNAMPFKLTTVHLVTIPQEKEEEGGNPSKWRLLADKFCNAVLQAIGNALLPYNSVFHRGATKKEVLLHLKRQGLSKRALPTCMGGNLTEEDIQLLILRQLRVEEKLFLSEEEKNERKRLMNQLHSRQKRVRRRIEWEVRVEQQAEIKAENERLKAENRELEQLLMMAKEEVERHEGRSRRGPQEILNEGKNPPVPLQGNSSDSVSASQPFRNSVFLGATFPFGDEQVRLQGAAPRFDPSSDALQRAISLATATSASPPFDGLSLLNRIGLVTQQARQHLSIMNNPTTGSMDSITQLFSQESAALASSADAVQRLRHLLNPASTDPEVISLFRRASLLGAHPLPTTTTSTGSIHQMQDPPPYLNRDDLLVRVLAQRQLLENQVQQQLSSILAPNTPISDPLATLSRSLNCDEMGVYDAF
jgi:hypothetical protein